MIKIKETKVGFSIGKAIFRESFGNVSITFLK